MKAFREWWTIRHLRNRKGKQVTGILDTLKTDLAGMIPDGLKEAAERIFADHETVISAALGDAAAAAKSPLAQVAATLLHVPASSQMALADFLQELDNDFSAAKPAEPVAPAEPAAPAVDVAAGVDPEAIPANRIPAVSGNGTGTP